MSSIPLPIARSTHTAAMSALSFLHSQLFVTPATPTYDFKDQTIIITGANRGIGLEAARHLLRLNAKKVILGVRSVKAGQDAAENLERSTGRTGAVQVEELDMASHLSVKVFASRMDKLDRLDAVLLNAGMYTHDFTKADGFETHLTVNVINTLFLALLLLPTLKKGPGPAKPRISFVSSDRHVMFNLPEWKEDRPFEVLSDEKGARMSERLVSLHYWSPNADFSFSYMISKLMLILLAREMAFYVDGSDVIVNSFTPGYCESGLINDIKGPKRWVLSLLKKATARTTEVGGRTLVAAIVPWPESHGKYLNDSCIDE